MQANTVSLFCVIVLFLGISCKEDDEENIPLVELMNLQDEHCHTVSLCAFRPHAGKSPPQNTSCCRECSCEAECMALGTCCPDYHLLDEIDRNVSYSASEFSARLRNINMTLDTQENVKCIETREPNYVTSIWSSTGYKMIARCPPYFDGNIDLPKKCEEPMNISNFQSDLFVPVTSLKTRKTYRNIYCYLCYEELDTSRSAYRYIRQFLVTMYCRDPHHVNITAVTPNEFVHTFINTQTKNNDCHLVFAPDGSVNKSRCDAPGFNTCPEGSAKDKPFFEKCDVIDFETCPEDSDKHLDELCKHFHLPVKHYLNKTMVQSYKNVACYLCRSDKPFISECTVNIPQPLEYGMRLKFMMHPVTGLIANIEEPEEAVLNIKELAEKNSKCNDGFIRIISSEGQPKCARVLCPLNYYPHKGSCHSAFFTTGGSYFTTMLDVRRPKIYNQETIDIIRKNYKEAIEDAALLFFDKFEWGSWEIDNTYDILAVSFTMTDIFHNYDDAMNLLESFLDTICTVDIVTNSAAIRVSISQTKNPKISFNSMSTLKPKPKRIRRYKEPDSSLKMVEFFNTHFCYRVSVPISEKKFYIENRLQEESIQYTKSGEMKVCIDDVNNNITDRKSTYKFKKACIQTTGEYMKNIQQFKTPDLVNNKNKRKNNKRTVSNNKLNYDNGRTFDNSKGSGDTITDSSDMLFAVGLPLAAVVVAATICICKKKKHTLKIEEMDYEYAEDEQENLQVAVK